MHKKRWVIAICFTFANLILHFSIMKDYGVSWDFHYHHYAGLFHLGLPVPSINDPSVVPFTPPDPRLTTEDPFGPFTQITPSLSYVYLFEKWYLLPFDSAYNFPTVVFGSLGVGLLFLFISEMIGIFPALVSALFLSLLPNYFGYLHNNMKDIPNAFAFTAAVYLFWRLVKYKRIKDLIFAVAAFAFAFNVKINSVMVPVVCFIWVVSYNFRKTITTLKGMITVIPAKAGIQTLRSGFRVPQIKSGAGMTIILLYFLFAPIAALALWWPFWRNPLQKLLELPYFYSHNTINMPILFFGKLFQSGVNIPFMYPYVYIAITTPIPILIGFLVGLFYALKQTIKRDRNYLLLLLWFFIPLVRYLSPKTPAIDGVRHFMEVVYPLSALAGVGMWAIYTFLVRKKISKNFIFACASIIIISLIYSIYHYHPYQTSYFNSLIGGIQGVHGKFDIDFWGTPQKEAMQWLNINAPQKAYVYIAMAQSSAAMYLRDDLRMNANKKTIWESDFAVILNRESFFAFMGIADYIDKQLLPDKIAYKRTIDGVPLVWVIKN